jgi:ABC-type nitrate/sulfonate/bicarbonate transport system ATPase subunit
VDRETPLLQVAGVAKTYPGSRREPPLRVLAGVDLEVGHEEFVALIGPSGCGKSTLLDIVSGLETPTAGTVALAGDRETSRLGRVAYMHQRDLLLPWRDVMGNAVLGLEIAGAGREEARARARALMAKFGLEGFEGAYPANLSGGMRQRVALLRTMLGDQPLILLDEPFGALDAITRAALQEWLGRVISEARRSALLVTHDVDEALLLSDRVYVMSGRPGRTIRTLEVDLERPRSQATVVTPRFVELKRELLETLARQELEAA